MEEQNKRLEANKQTPMVRDELIAAKLYTGVAFLVAYRERVVWEVVAVGGCIEIVLALLLLSRKSAAGPRAKAA